MGIKINEKEFYSNFIDKLKKEREALGFELGAVSKSLQFCDSAIRYYEHQLSLLALVEFCNTGKYPR